MQKNNNLQAFISLVRAGLWENDIELSRYDPIDFWEVYRLAKEQSVVGLVAAGLEHVSDVKIPHAISLIFAEYVLQLEHRNNSMNQFIVDLIKEFRQNNLYPILVKGQGVAQCYSRPLWRSSGDVDILLTGKEYIKAKEIVNPMATKIGCEDSYRLQIGFEVTPWTVELHGTLRGELWNRLDNLIDEVKEDIFSKRNVRIWDIANTEIYLPSPDNDVIFVFSHILQHFFKEGIGLRQICDLCRLIYTYHKTLNEQLLKNRLKASGILSEWYVFASLAVSILGIPADIMPLYNPSDLLKNKANQVLDIVLISGNMGHNKDYSFRYKYPFIIQKVIAIHKYTKETLCRALIFPKDSLKCYYSTLLSGFRCTFFKYNEI